MSRRHFDICWTLFLSSVNIKLTSQKEKKKHGRELFSYWYFLGLWGLSLNSFGFASILLKIWFQCCLNLHIHVISQYQFTDSSNELEWNICPPHQAYRICLIHFMQTLVLWVSQSRHVAASSTTFGWMLLLLYLCGVTDWQCLCWLVHFKVSQRLNELCKPEDESCSPELHSIIISSSSSLTLKDENINRGTVMFTFWLLSEIVSLFWNFANILRPVQNGFTVTLPLLSSLLCPTLWVLTIYQNSQ